MVKHTHIMLSAILFSLCAACGGLPAGGYAIAPPRPLVADGAPSVQHPGAAPIITTALLGDSIIAQLGPNAVPNSVNLAISGGTIATIQGELAHMPASITTVIMDGGTNDLLGLGNKPEQVKAAYVALLAAIPSNIKVELIGVPPVNESLLKPGFSVTLNDHLIAETNALIRSICTGNCSFIGNPFGHTLNPALTTDGIHMTDAGKAALIAALQHPSPVSHMAWHSFGGMHHAWHNAMMHQAGGMPMHMTMMHPMMMHPHCGAMHGGGHH